MGATACQCRPALEGSEDCRLVGALLEQGLVGIFAQREVVR